MDESHPEPGTTGQLRTVPLRRIVPGLLRDPARALIDAGNRTGGAVVRLNLGSFRPYLVTHPRHVQHVLRDRAENYERAGDGLFWRPVKRLFGEGILGEGQIWSASRRMLQPMFTAKRVEALIDGMAEAIGDAVDELGEPSRAGRTVDIGVEQARIVSRAIMRVLFADKISVPDAMRVIDAQDVIATAVIPRIIVPFAPLSLPMPGDRPFRRAVRIVDDVLVPIVRATRTAADDGDDIISTLWRARTEDGRPLDERQVRNDTVAMFAATTETTINVLTWLWPHLDQHPDVADRLYAEVDRVVGGEPVRREHLRDLTYTRMVLDELLRLYPIGWIIPRRAVAADVIDGVPIEAGATMVASPLITQRMAQFWERPEEFDPERFRPEAIRTRHRYAHFPFGGGPHQCLGMYLFYLEAQLIIATMLSRYRFRLRRPGVPGLRLAAALRPRERVELTLLGARNAD
ncbi:cytochrome P450 [Micromonospora sp. 4G57]|uniref:Cytochrome P450 n=1 Tax=Micromonospora sicca TaxID=2202420 RepID=A0ABU5JKT1_9ACTN|nr:MULTISPECIES: cytochrome P450 [unclassified Micromonospora]MDZ5444092.1 cytochrome P450 [Micromonospora sp. 4G57]MDZ5493243.1 cytochrome P450 [Micromonospora sp. 4G53]